MHIYVPNAMHTILHHYYKYLDCIQSYQSMFTFKYVHVTIHTL